MRLLEHVYSKNPSVSIVRIDFLTWESSSALPSAFPLSYF